MNKRTRALSAILVAIGLVTVSAGASARDHGHDRYEHGERGWGPGGRWAHDHDRREVRVIERRYIVREQPRYYYEPVPVYERPRPIYRQEPGISVRIGLPPIIIR